METLTDNLARMRPAADGASYRAADDTKGRTLFGHFTVFNVWYEVSSFFEGNFMERMAPGSCKRTIAERGDQVKALYDHGHDPTLGNKPLGPFTSLKEDKVGGFYEVSLIDTDYNRDFIIPAAEAGLLGASFRFRIREESWKDDPGVSDHNPKGLPERTILDIDLYELGPVTFPANADADAALRSTSDDFINRLVNDPLFVARFTERAGLTVAEKLLSTLAPDGSSTSTSRSSADGQGEAPSGTDPRAVRALAANLRR